MGDQGVPKAIVLALHRWGWLLHAPKDGEDFKVGLEEFDSDKATRLVNEELPNDADEETRAGRVGELPLLVRVQDEERARFDVDDPDAALIVRISSGGADAEGEQ